MAAGSISRSSHRSPGCHTTRCSPGCAAGSLDTTPEDELRRAAIIVLDGVGAGAAPDAATYGDEGSNTLGHLASAVGGLDLPNMMACGLGNIAPLDGVDLRDPAMGA